MHIGVDWKIAPVRRQIPSGREMAANLELKAVLQSSSTGVEIFFHHAE
jgi:hypothetical protein